jgi:hypothetical protein
MIEDRTYTAVELRLALLEQSTVGILGSITRLETKLDSLDKKIDGHFHWMMGSVSVLYISLIGTLVTALAKSLHWF